MQHIRIAQNCRKVKPYRGILYRIEKNNYDKYYDFINAEKHGKTLFHCNFAICLKQMIDCKIAHLIQMNAIKIYINLNDRTATVTRRGEKRWLDCEQSTAYSLLSMVHGVMMNVCGNRCVIIAVFLYYVVHTRSA